jgi:hypothetical protein
LDDKPDLEKRKAPTKSPAVLFLLLAQQFACFRIDQVERVYAEWGSGCISPSDGTTG